MKPSKARYLAVVSITLVVSFLFSSLFAEDTNHIRPDSNVAGGNLRAEKKSSAEYWKDFKRDTNQTWKNTQAAYRAGFMEGKLEIALSINEQLSLYLMESRVDNGTASLKGEVGSETDRELAESIALGIDGIDSVDNRLTVNTNLTQKQDEEDEEAAKTTRTFSQYMIDISTTASLKTELLKSPQISGMAIDVNTYNGRVTLSGTVKTRQEHEVVEAIVKKHHEVKKVINDLEVAS